MPLPGLRVLALVRAPAFYALPWPSLTFVCVLVRAAGEQGHASTLTDLDGALAQV